MNYKTVYGGLGGEEMIIEFIGLTGIGKSATMTELQKALVGEVICSQGFKTEQLEGCSWKNIKLKNISPKWIYQTFLLIYYLIYIFLFVSKQEYWRRKRYFGKILRFWVAYRILDSSKENEKILLVDEGLFNGLSSLIHVDKISDRYLEKVCKILSSYFQKGNLLVYFNATENISFTRIRERKGDSRFDTIKDSDKLMEQLQKKRMLFEREIKCLNRNVEMIYLEAETSIEEKRKIIMEELNEQRQRKEKNYDYEK